MEDNHVVLMLDAIRVSRNEPGALLRVMEPVFQSLVTHGAHEAEFDSFYYISRMFAEHFSTDYHVMLR